MRRREPGERSLVSLASHFRARCGPASVAANFVPVKLFPLRFASRFPISPLRRAAGVSLVVLATLCAIATDAAAVTAQVDASVTQQTIRGFGGATVFQPPGLPASLASSELDTLFNNGTGQLGFTILRIRVASDDAWRAVELAHAKGAIARGAIVMATPWSPPAAMKSNNSTIGGSLNAAAYADYAKYLNDFALYMSANGAPLHAISVQNEPDISVTYESCDWTPAQMLAFCRNNAGAISATKLMAPESFQFRRAMSDPLLNDAVAAENLDIIGGHIYGGGFAPYPLAVTKGKEVWMTEHYDNQATDWPGALATGKEIHDCLATYNFNAYIWWYLRRFYGPLGEDGLVTKRGFVMAQFAKFIRPGYVRIGATANPATGVFVSAYKREKLVIVAINQGAADVPQTFALANATVASLTPWTSSSTLALAAQPAIAVTGGSFTATLPAGSVTTFVGDVVLAAPTIVTAPRSARVAPGSNLVLEAATTGEFLSYQWTKNGVAVRGATNPSLTLSNVSATDAGNYTVTVANAGGSITSAAAALSLAPAGSDGRLANLSTRSLVGPGDNVQIAGFVIKGVAKKKILVRAAGPVLRTAFGFANALEDPSLEVLDNATGATVARNDDWDASLEPDFAAVGAFGWTRGSKDAALVASLPPGNYTAIVRGAGSTTGVALVEVYEADGGTGSTLINLSTRSLIGGDDNPQIAGLAVGGSAPKTVVVRAAGPTLHKAFGLVGALADPVIELRRAGRNELIATSDDWSSYLAPHFASVGAFAWPAESRDAALVVTLEPGSYSVVVRGRSNGTGLAIVEVYAEP